MKPCDRGRRLAGAHFGRRRQQPPLPPPQQQPLRPPTSKPLAPQRKKAKEKKGEVATGLGAAKTERRTARNAEKAGRRAERALEGDEDDLDALLAQFAVADKAKKEVRSAVRRGGDGRGCGEFAAAASCGGGVWGPRAERLGVGDPPRHVGGVCEWVASW
jgi:type IV secretory pathway VirB10-like protein